MIRKIKLSYDNYKDDDDEDDDDKDDNSLDIDTVAHNDNDDFDNNITGKRFEPRTTYLD